MAGALLSIGCKDMSHTDVSMEAQPRVCSTYEELTAVVPNQALCVSPCHSSYKDTMYLCRTSSTIHCDLHLCVGKVVISFLKINTQQSNLNMSFDGDNLSALESEAFKFFSLLFECLFGVDKFYQMV